MCDVEGRVRSDEDVQRVPHDLVAAALRDEEAAELEEDGEFGKEDGDAVENLDNVGLLLWSALISHESGAAAHMEESGHVSQSHVPLVHPEALEHANEGNDVHGHKRRDCDGDKD